MEGRKKAMVHLPEDIVEREILPSLPVRSLLRFRCVSKKICALIDSPDFIKQHLIINNNSHNTIAKTNQLNLLIDGSELYLFSLQGLAGQLLPLPQTHIVGGYSFSLQGIPADEPLQLRLSLEEYDRMYGSVNGLLCLLDYKSTTNDIIIILNPATKRDHELPLPLHDFSPPRPRGSKGILHQRFFGFGYDSVSDDFKLVRIKQLLHKPFVGGMQHLVSQAQVYSLRSNSWKRIQDLPAGYKFDYRSSEFVCGALHWMVSLTHPNQNEIFSLDLVTERHKLVAKPDYNIQDQDMCFTMSVGKLGGCLSLTCNSNGDRVDVWVMKDYGVKESWNKLFSISYEQGINSYMSLTPVAYSERGDEILLVISKELLWYNPDTRKARKIYSGSYYEFRVFVCGESMVPLSTKAWFL